MDNLKFKTRTLKNRRVRHPKKAKTKTQPRKRVL
jgi:hypothetical protein